METQLKDFLNIETHAFRFKICESCDKFIDKPKCSISGLNIVTAIDTPNIICPLDKWNIN